ncbi:MAG: hypothetical protein AAF648_11615 [Pseudomonadota bacterium]
MIEAQPIAPTESATNHRHWIGPALFLLCTSIAGAHAEERLSTPVDPFDDGASRPNLSDHLAVDSQSVVPLASGGLNRAAATDKSNDDADTAGKEDGEFKPSEEVSEDFAISFPVDI